MKDKTYIAFDGDSDIRYYWLMKAWKHNNQDFFQFFHFYDSHDINYSRDTSQETSIKRQLSLRLDETKLFVLLVGDSTRYLYKFVRWEIEQALDRNIPIVVVNINGKKQMDSDRCPSLLKDKLVLHISFNQKIIEHAFNNWISQSENYRRMGKSGPFYYPDTLYNQLGI